MIIPARHQKMAAPCNICGEFKGTLFSATSGKKAYENNIPFMYFYVSGIEIIPDTKICRACYRELEKSTEFKRRIEFSVSKVHTIFILYYCED